MCFFYIQPDFGNKTWHFPYRDLYKLDTPIFVHDISDIDFF